MVCRTHLRTSHVEDYKIRVKKKTLMTLEITLKIT